MNTCIASRNLRSLLWKIFHPASHYRMVATGETEGDCLRILEKDARLPLGDLSIAPNTPSTVGRPIPIFSQTAKDREQKGRPGYTSGTIVFAGKRTGDGKYFTAELNVSKNCNGHFENGVCTECGSSQP